MQPAHPQALATPDFIVKCHRPLILATENAVRRVWEARSKGQKGPDDGWLSFPYEVALCHRHLLKTPCRKARPQELKKARQEKRARRQEIKKARQAKNAIDERLLEQLGNEYGREPEKWQDSMLVSMKICHEVMKKHAVLMKEENIVDVTVLLRRLRNLIRRYKRAAAVPMPPIAPPLASLPAPPPLIHSPWAPSWPLAPIAPPLAMPPIARPVVSLPVPPSLSLSPCPPSWPLTPIALPLASLPGGDEPQSPRVTIDERLLDQLRNEYGREPEKWKDIRQVNMKIYHEVMKEHAVLMKEENIVDVTAFLRRLSTLIRRYKRAAARYNRAELWSYGAMEHFRAEAVPMQPIAPPLASLPAPPPLILSPWPPSWPLAPIAPPLAMPPIDPPLAMPPIAPLLTSQPPVPVPHAPLRQP